MFFKRKSLNPMYTYLLAPMWIVLSLFMLIIIFRLLNELYVQTIENISIQYFIYGVITYAISLVLIRPKHYRFWDTFFHELSHIIFALFTLSNVKKLMVAPEMPENGAAGYVQFKAGSFSRFKMLKEHLISLAPYFFSPVSFFLTLLYILVLPKKNEWFFQAWFIKEPTLHGLLFLIGLFYAYHVFTSLKQARPYQSDFDQVGYKYGMTFVIFVQVLILLFMVIAFEINNGSLEYTDMLISEVIYIDLDKIFNNINLEQIKDDINIFMDALKKKF